MVPAIQHITYRTERYTIIPSLLGVVGLLRYPHEVRNHEAQDTALATSPPPSPPRPTPLYDYVSTWQPPLTAAVHKNAKNLRMEIPRAELDPPRYLHQHLVGTIPADRPPTDQALQYLTFVQIPTAPPTLPDRVVARQHVIIPSPPTLLPAPGVTQIIPVPASHGYAEEKIYIYIIHIFYVVN